MKQFYLIFIFLASFFVKAQTTVTYPQQVENYDAFFTVNGGNFNDGTDQIGMWANGATDPKHSVVWRNFTDDGTTTGTQTTMVIGDSFTITLSATRAYGVIGVALLSSPAATATWADRINNYAVQVNLDGGSGAFSNNWEVISDGGTVDTSVYTGSTTVQDIEFKFTLDTATTMTVKINNVESHSITLNNTDITGYSVYLENDWNGVANSNLIVKPTSQYVYATTLNTNTVEIASDLRIYPNPVENTFKVNQSMKSIEVFNIAGKLVKTFNSSFDKNHSFDISNLTKGIYFAALSNSLHDKEYIKIIKK